MKEFFNEREKEEGKRQKERRNYFYLSLGHLLSSIGSPCRIGRLVCNKTRSEDDSRNWVACLLSHIVPLTPGTRGEVVGETWRYPLVVVRLVLVMYIVFSVRTRCESEGVVGGGWERSYPNLNPQVKRFLSTINISFYFVHGQT